jgi:hypothetical protein
VAVEKAIGGPAEVVDIQDIDTEDTVYAPVVKAFNTFGIGALPIITLDGKPVCMATTYPQQIAAILEREIGKNRANKNP